MSIKNSSFVFRLFSLFILFTLLFSAVGVAPVSAGGGGHIYAKPTASGTGNCLNWNTFLGGSEFDYGNAIAVDDSGNVYTIGSSSTTWGTPVRAYAGSGDAFVAKLDSNGVLQWNTFLGGNNHDWGHGIAVDNNGNVYVSGFSQATWSTPVRAFSAREDAFVAKLDSNGVLQWNTFLGGSRGDVGNAIAVDGNSNVYVVGTSDATWGAPVHAFTDGNDGFAGDAFAAKLDSSSGALQWNTFLGDSGYDNGNSIAVDGNNNVYVAGSSGIYTDANNAFAVKLNSTGVLQWNTFLGGSGGDGSNGIAVDGNGNVYVVGGSGVTWSAPVRAHNGNSYDAFAAKLDSSGALQWNTFLGGTGLDFGTAIAVDSSNNVYLTGYSDAAWGAPARAFGEGYDAFAAQLDANGALQLNIFLGGNGSDFGNGIAMDGSGNLYVTGSSHNLWGTPVRAFNDYEDAFIVKLPPPATNADLNNLVLSTGALNPVFETAITTYTQSVLNVIASLTVTPTVADASATVTVNGTVVASGSASSPINLVDGSNTITIVVTAQNDTTTQAYTVTVTPVEANRILHATSDGTGDCSSWANACTLQTALVGALGGDEIWATAGTHKPTTETDRTATFQLKSGVPVYGGFSGIEIARNQRNPAVNVAILSGDIGAQGDKSDNSYHVVTGVTGATLDGFIITAGNANYCTYPDNRGGGMYNNSSAPVLINLTFNDNSAKDGGGMYNNSSAPILMNVTFSGNTATDSGGGLYNNSSRPMLTNITFSGNSANYGGGIFNWSSSNPTLTNVIFSGNSATGSGGGMNSDSSNPELTNVTFSGNSAGSQGGGICSESSNLILTNVTFSSNTAGIYGGGLYNLAGNYQIRNAIFWGNGGTQIYNDSNSSVVSDSVVQGGCPAGSTCTNIFTTDPKLGTLGNYGGLTQTIPLLAGSSAIDTGNNTGCPPSDQRGVHRPLDGDGNGTRLCDIGAYEFPGATFADVPITHSAWNYIERLYAAGITGGCATNPLKYCPNNSVTRAQMAVFLLRGMHGSSYTPPAATGTVFGDVPVTHPQAAWIEQLNTEGITGGCGGGNYCPANSVTRAQMAVFLLRAKHGAAYTPPAASGTMFADVPLSHPQAAWIEQLSNEGVTGGCGAGNYCPANPVTRAQMAIFLVRAFNLP